MSPITQSFYINIIKKTKCREEHQYLLNECQKLFHPYSMDTAFIQKRFYPLPETNRYTTAYQFTNELSNIVKQTTSQLRFHHNSQSFLSKFASHTKADGIGVQHLEPHYLSVTNDICFFIDSMLMFFFITLDIKSIISLSCSNVIFL